MGPIVYRKPPENLRFSNFCSIFTTEAAPFACTVFTLKPYHSTVTTIKHITLSSDHSERIGIDARAGTGSGHFFVL